MAYPHPRQDTQHSHHRHQHQPQHRPQHQRQRPVYPNEQALAAMRAGTVVTGPVCWHQMWTQGRGGAGEWIASTVTVPVSE